ncbi:glycosyltransferase 87 family protein [Corynebacterium sp. 153RC1]|uniref:glycosyltransferase 87 family protein n=1 Tax=unclassified Corynebacterium TaxID=2624378 RepID=UPI00211C263C|nr:MULTISPECIES: glycosyltransferase 87 family protein [unclassified Corynebacterium]MCQ9352267.1 glycosyltransferase 87 family protein [Corynebacterium sp. 209RC1]MCQ9354343.1 glycosyltransferase 87 family protein [Corynebacterium sp. 1222RC1]MCQ9356625.1 glycosyltransferase 87 family protein [Corynebacterium sp. 122RC1]MCQ9359635.1 glycosyltransferase 87 family protein [Corynebacterium sp. 142RC1]MCQ9360577.1 glycosyltransferase 87 family protein [Corynebacterium sp. 153RC1]
MKASVPRLNTAFGLLVVPLAVVALCLWVIDPLSFWREDLPLIRYHIDYDVYRHGGAAFLAGEPLYSQLYSVAGINLPFTYPPFAALLFSLLAVIPLELGSTLFTLATVAALWHCVRLTLAHVGTTTPRAGTLAAVITLPLLFLEPVRETLGFGQINVLLMWLVMVDTLHGKGSSGLFGKFQGVGVGIAAAIKLTPAVFGLYFLVRKQWRAASYAVASGVLCSALAWVISPDTSREYWMETVREPSRIGGLAWVTNQSFEGFLQRNPQLTGTSWLGLSLGLIPLVVIVMLLLVRRGAFPAALLANAAVALLCSPVSWSHHWVWMAILLVYTGALAQRYWAKGRGRRQARALVAVSGLTALIAGVGPHWLPSTALVLSEAYILFTLALLVAVPAVVLCGGWRAPTTPTPA